MSLTRLACKPFDNGDNANDYQYPPKNHKNPTEPTERRIAEIHHIVCSSRHHIHHGHPTAASCGECRRSVATDQTFTHDNVNLLLAVFAVHLNHHGVHGGVRISGHNPHKVFTKHFILLIIQIRTSNFFCLELTPKLSA